MVPIKKNISKTVIHIEVLSVLRKMNHPLMYLQYFCVVVGLQDVYIYHNITAGSSDTYHMSCCVIKIKFLVAAE